MVNKLSGISGKVIKISEGRYNALHNLKFDLRLDTFDEVVGALLEEHRQKQEVST